MPPVPCGASRETVKRLELAGWAGYGYCAARTRWYWGLKLYLVTAPDGMPAAWCPASPKPGEREVARDLLAHAARSGALRPGFTPSVTRALRGGTSSIWSLPGQGCTWSVRTGGTRRPGTGPSTGSGSGSNRSTTPSRPARPRTPWRPHPRGLYARITQRLLAMAACIWHNWAAGEPVKRSLVASDN